MTRNPSPNQPRPLPEDTEPGLHGERVWLFFPHPVIVTDANDQILSANPAARRLLGSETDGHLWSRLVPVDGAPIVPPATGPGDDVPWLAEMDITCGTHADERCTFKVSMRPIAETGGSSAARLWILEDQTEHQRIAFRETQRGHLEQRAFMAAEIAHDLNNHLAVLSGNAELLPMYLGDNLSESVERSLANLRKTLAQMERFTSSCLRLRQPASECGTIDLNEFLADEITFLRPQKRFKHVVIETDFDSNIPSVVCEPAALRQVFYNLMLNAADALRDYATDAFTITVRTEPAALDGMDSVRFTVSDCGPGVPSELAPRLFRERVSSRPGCGGFGLLTVDEVIRQQGGEVSFTNRTDGGAAFSVVLHTPKAARHSPATQHTRRAASPVV